MTHAVARFRVLGPVGLWVGQAAVPLGGPRPRAVLAVLLLARGKTVSAQRLVDAVWGEEPPASATGRVHAVISGLRQAMAEAGLGGEVIRTAPGGYALDAPAGSVDAVEFQERAAAGSRAAEQAQYAAAVAHFRAALDMWTGRALEGLAGPFAEQEAERWEALRLDVLEACAAAQLEAPGPPAAGLIHELSGLASANPQREGLVALLMRALRRAGRGPEALAAYRANQRWLREELGLDPPKRLAALASAILRDEPGGRAPGRAGASPAGGAAATSGGAAGTARPAQQSPMPRAAQLPAGVVGFAGREAELAGLDDLLAESAGERSGSTVALITGPAGVGKTELALHWSHRAAGRFPDGQLFVNLRGHAQSPPREPAEALRGFLRALGVPAPALPADQDEAAALYRSLLAERRMLIVLDNAASPHQVRPLLPGAGGCRVLVTSRHRLGGLIARDGAGTLSLHALESVHALALLRRIVGPARIETEPDPARRIIEICGRMPLGVRIAATRLVNAPELSLAEFGERLEQTGPLRTLTVEGDEQGGLAATLRLSFQALTAPAARLFALFGVGGFEDFSAPCADALAGGDASRMIDELVDAHLLTRTVGGRLVLHDLVAEYAAQCSITELPRQDTDEAARRVLGWYIEAAKAAVQVVYPTASAALRAQPCEGAPRPPVFEEHADALDWLETERANLAAAVRLAADRRMHRNAVDLAYLLVAYYDLSKHWDDWIATHEIAARSAACLGDAPAQARALNYAGVAYQQLGRLEQALVHQQRALELSRTARDGRLEAVVCTSVGVTYAIGGQTLKGLSYLERALSLHRAHGNADGETLALNNLAEAQTELGMHAEALASLEEALAIAVRLGNDFNIRVISCSLGVLHGAAGRHDEAVASFQRAIETGEATHDRYGVAETLGCLGDLLHRTGKANEAHLRWKQAAELFDDVDPQQAAALRTRTAECCGERGFTPQSR